MTGPITHLLNRQLEVWRPAATDDDYGGRRVQHILQGTVMAKVDQASAAERSVAQQGGAALTHSVYLQPDADVQRGDQLRGNGETYRVTGTVTPSTPVYLKAECEQIQAAPT